MSERVYLLLGPEVGNKSDKVRGLIKQLTKEYKEKPQISKYYPFDGNDKDMYVELNNMDMFSAHTLVILSQIETMTEPQAKDLLQYVKSPSSAATLVMTSNETRLSGTSLKKIADYVKGPHYKSESYEIFYELKEDQLSQWVGTFFAKLGLNINRAAIELLLDLVDNNTMELKIICRQLSYFWQVNNNTGTITESDIETYVHHTRDENAFTLFNAMATETLSDALGIVSVILERTNNAQFVLIGGLLWSWRRLHSITELIEGGMSQREALQNATVLGQMASIRRPSDFVTYNGALSRYNATNCKNIISLLFAADINLRKATGEIQRIETEKLVYDIMVNKGTVAEDLKGAQFPSL